MSGGKRIVSLTLPWPPTVNTYWRRRGARYFIAKPGVAFRKRVGEIAMTKGIGQPLTGPVLVRLQGNPPDRRKRDLDNILKAVFDSLRHAGVYVDDAQVSRIEAEKLDPMKGGRLVVMVEER